MTDFPITGHMVVKNEDRFVWFAINSALPYLEKLIIYDTGSTDKTIEIIKSIRSSKIIFEEKGLADATKLVNLRRDQIARTKTEFFFLLDGDETWPDKNIRKLFAVAAAMPKEKLAVFCRTRNAVGDVWHYLPQDAGQYHLGGMKGHFNIRLFRKTPDLDITGEYPLEAYTYSGQPINKLDHNLVFTDVWYLHATHLTRSSESGANIAGPSRQSKLKYELGIPLAQDEIPKIFFQERPNIIPDPLIRRSSYYFSRALLETPLRKFKRKFL